jgi:hypothetical protein
MHKARENVNGTFSIGKTWQLDDLSAVQSYSGMAATSAEEEQQKQWAGGVGFTVTIGKPYYWQANTQKEKQFFIASLVKIYTKYTGGKSPELVGFDAREREQLLGASASTRPPPPQQPPAPGPGAGPGAGPGQGPPPYGPPQNRPPRRDPSREPVMRAQPSREYMQRPPPQMAPSGASPYSQMSRPPPMRSRREDSPSGSVESGGTGPPPPSLRRLAGTNQSQDSFARSDDNNSLPPRSRGGMNGIPNAPGRFQDPSITPNSQQRAVTPEGSFSSGKDTFNDALPVPAPLTIPPERRRPPMPILGDSRQRGQSSNDNIVPAPLVSPGMRRDEQRPPTRSSERSQPRERSLSEREREQDTNLNMRNTPAAMNGSGRPEPPRNMSEDISKNEVPQSSASTTSIPPLQPAITSPPPPVPDMPEEPEEETRPGLGPMIKKKSKGDIANTFLRAAKTANAFSSFKPRAGGAAERLREAQAKAASEGPDGITGVVPAPSLLRAASDDTAKSAPERLKSPLDISKSPEPSVTEKVVQHKANNSIPEVKITVPQSARPSSIEGPMKPTQDTLTEKTKTRETKKAKSPAETMAKELASLGIDPAILDGRGSELVDTWEEFGWVGEGIRTKNIDQMKEEVDRELNRMQAGGWLKMMDEEDERIQAIKDGLDKTIEECDELDGLLTLYLVELGVSFLHFAQNYLLTVLDAH